MFRVQNSNVVQIPSHTVDHFTVSHSAILEIPHHKKRRRECLQYQFRGTCSQSTNSYFIVGSRNASYRPCSRTQFVSQEVINLNARGYRIQATGHGSHVIACTINVLNVYVLRAVVSSSSHKLCPTFHTAHTLHSVLLYSEHLLKYFVGCFISDVQHISSTYGVDIILH